VASGWGLRHRLWQNWGQSTNMTESLGVSLQHGTVPEFCPLKAETVRLPERYSTGGASGVRTRTL
jgi:hypothetical protein